MKKKIVGIALLSVMAIATGWNINQSKNIVSLTDIAICNVEALADCEKIAGSCWLSYYTLKCCGLGDVGCSPCGN